MDAAKKHQAILSANPETAFKHHKSKVKSTGKKSQVPYLSTKAKSSTQKKTVSKKSTTESKQDKPKKQESDEPVFKVSSVKKQFKEDDARIDEIMEAEEVSEKKPKVVPAIPKDSTPIQEVIGVVGNENKPVQEEEKTPLKILTK